MSNSAMAWARHVLTERADISNRAARVLVAVADGFDDRKSGAWVGIERIRQHAHMDYDAARDSLAELRSAGILNVVDPRRGRRPTGYGLPGFDPEKWQPRHLSTEPKQEPTAPPMGAHVDRPRAVTVPPPVSPPRRVVPVARTRFEPLNVAWLTEWCGWESERREVCELPDDFEWQLTRWRVSFGVTERALLDACALAMIRCPNADGVWRYFCKVVWHATENAARVGYQMERGTE